MLPNGYRVRPAVPGDVALLPHIERTAALLFKSYPDDLGLTEEIYAHVNSAETFANAQQAGHLWVCAARTGDVVGFAPVLDIGGYAHLDELDVLPLHGRQGVGSALLGAVCSWARDADYPAVTLRTFRQVPWNAPFYQRRGVRVVESTELSPEHVELETIERERGLRTDLRVTMAYTTVGLTAGLKDYDLVSPTDEKSWRAYHDIRRRVLFEARGQFGVYDEKHPDESAPGNYSKLLLYRGDPVGVVRIDIDATIAILRRVAIRSEAQRLGHGRVLLSLAQQFAQDNGCEQLASYVAPDAVEFYRRFGFAIEKDRVVGPSGREAVFMTKRL